MIDRRNVIKRQQYSRQELHDEKEAHYSAGCLKRSGDKTCESVRVLAEICVRASFRRTTHAFVMCSSLRCPVIRYCTCNLPPCTRAGSGSNPRRAGPDNREPSAAKKLSWQGHEKRFASCSQATSQPSCGHTAEKTWLFLPGST